LIFFILMWNLIMPTSRLPSSRGETVGRRVRESMGSGVWKRPRYAVWCLATAVGMFGYLIPIVNIVSDSVGSGGQSCNEGAENLWVWMRSPLLFSAINKITYVTLRDMRVWTKISYWILYETTTKYMCLESSRRDLQNDVKILIKIKIFLLSKKIQIKTNKKIQFLWNLRKKKFFNSDFYIIL